MRAKMVVGFWLWTWLLPMVLSWVVSLPATAEDKKTKVYVKDFGGDITPKIGEVIAAKVAAVLVKTGEVEALTFRNLNDQLKEEERKEVFACAKETSCLDEVIASFGYARRLFGHVTKLREDEYSLDISYFVREKLVGRDSQSLSCPERSLPEAAAALACTVVGVSCGAASSVGVIPGPESEKPVEFSAPEAEHVVEFASTPAGAMVEVDGAPKSATPCTLYLSAKPHRIRMALSKFDPHEEMVMIESDRRIEWRLTPSIGWLDITSEPSGLAVKVSRSGREDATNVVTPVTSMELDPGSYLVESASDQYYVERKQVTIAKGARQTASLSPKAKQGFLKVKAFDERGNALKAEVWAGSSMLGTTPGPWTLTVGSYEIEIRTVGYETVARSVSIRLGETVETTAKLQAGVLQPDIEPIGSATEAFEPETSCTEEDAKKTAESGETALLDSYDEGLSVDNRLKRLKTALKTAERCARSPSEKTSSKIRSASLHEFWWSGDLRAYLNERIVQLGMGQAFWLPGIFYEVLDNEFLPRWQTDHLPGQYFAHITATDNRKVSRIRLASFKALLRSVQDSRSLGKTVSAAVTYIRAVKRTSDALRLAEAAEEALDRYVRISEQPVLTECRRTEDPMEDQNWGRGGGLVNHDRYYWGCGDEYRSLPAVIQFIHRRVQSGLSVQEMRQALATAKKLLSAGQE